MLTIKRTLFYILSFTWGFITSFIGLIILLIPLFTTHTIHCWHGRLYGVMPKCFGEGWGFEMGCFWFVANNCDEYSNLNSEFMGHEAGHGLQNIIFGPLQIFLVSIPSVIRYWYRELKFYRKGKEPTTAYDDIWFEGWATNLGKKYILTDKW
jgi:hypothetical protein